MKIKKWLKRKLGCQAGVTLVEAAVAVMVLGSAVLTMVLGLSGGALAVQHDDSLVTAQGLARTQMEYVKQLPYDPDAATYPSVEAPEGYAIDVTVTEVPETDANIQKVTAAVSRGGETVFTVQDYKVDR